MKIPIHKHTPVRRRPSMYKTEILLYTYVNGLPLLYSTNIPRTGLVPLITDISKPTYRNVMNKPTPEYVNLKPPLIIKGNYPKRTGFIRNLSYHIKIRWCAGWNACRQEMLDNLGMEEQTK